MDRVESVVIPDMVHPRSKPLGGARARCRIGRDEFFTSDNDQGVFEHLRLVGFLLVCTSTGLLIDRVRGASRCVCFCFLSAAEMVGVGVGYKCSSVLVSL